jgi:hypothetical protein
MVVVRFLTIAFLASIRLLMTAPVAFLAGMSLSETIIAVNTGGLVGFVVFYFLSDLIQYRRSIGIRNNKPIKVRNAGKKIKRIRRIIRYRDKVGPWPLILTAPFLSVPVGAFVIRKLYRRSFWVFVVSLLVILFWGTLSCLFFSPVGLI